MDVKVDKILTSVILDVSGSGIPYHAIDSLKSSDTAIVFQLQRRAPAISMVTHSEGYTLIFPSASLPSPDAAHQDSVQVSVNIPTAAPQIVMLKMVNGDVYEGSFVSSNDSTATYQTSSGILTVRKSMVLAIEPEFIEKELKSDFKTSEFSQNTMHREPFQAGCVELALSGFAGSMKQTNSMDIYMQDAVNYFTLNFSLGYYLVNGLSVEPQYGILAYEEGPPAHSLQLGLSYTGRIARSNLALFLRGGFGIANSPSYPIFGNALLSAREKWDVHILTVGAGLKYLVSDAALLKVELNYRQEKYPDTYVVYSYTYNNYNYFPYYEYHTIDLTNSFMGILIGFSVLL